MSVTNDWQVPVVEPRFMRLYLFPPNHDASISATLPTCSRMAGPRCGGVDQWAGWPPSGVVTIDASERGRYIDGNNLS